VGISGVGKMSGVRNVSCEVWMQNHDSSLSPLRYSLRWTYLLYYQSTLSLLSQLVAVFEASPVGMIAR
jgi:hypothetical protein